MLSLAISCLAGPEKFKRMSQRTRQPRSSVREKMGARRGKGTRKIMRRRQGGHWRRRLNEECGRGWQPETDKQEIMRRERVDIEEED